MMASHVEVKVEIPDATGMTPLFRNALAKVPLPHCTVQAIYVGNQIDNELCRRLCESHERLRMEVEGAGVLLNKLDLMQNEVASVLMLMDNQANIWGDEGVFRRCRDRLRALLPKSSTEVQP